MTYLGAITGLFDDFFDKKKMSESYIKNLINNPQDEVGNDSNERLFINFYKKALENSVDINLVKNYFLKVFEAQIISKNQMHQDIKQDEIKNITYQKGGISILFYRSPFSEYLNKEEETMIYKLGSLGQFENDIFDIYKDYKDGIKTLATTETKINNLRKIYKSLMKEIFYLVHKTSYPIKNKIKFLRFISLIICRGIVCLDFLEKNEKLTNKVFTIEDYERKDLICNMENPKHVLKLFNYYAKCKIEFR